MIEIGCNNIHSEITKLKKLNGILLKDSDLCNLKNNNKLQSNLGCCPPLEVEEVHRRSRKGGQDKAKESHF